MKKASILLFLLFICFSCKDNKTEEIKKIVGEWTGKTIIFPGNLECNSMGKDTICPDLTGKSYKILVYVDSAGCTECKLGLSEWKDLMSEIKLIAPEKVEFLFFFNPKKDGKELIRLLKIKSFEHPVFIDKKDELNKLNRFPSGNMQFQCFLLDRNNQVLLIGNPILNAKIEELYKQKIIE